MAETPQNSENSSVNSNSTVVDQTIASPEAGIEVTPKQASTETQDTPVNSETEAPQASPQVATPQENAAPQSPEGTTQNPPTLDKNLINPLDTVNKQEAYSSGVLKNIVDTETSTGEEQILDSAPVVDTSLLEEVAPTKSVSLLSFKIAFGFLFAISLGSILFFTSQLTDNLSFAGNLFNIPSISKQLETTNQQVLNLQTDLNYYRTLQLKAHLDRFSFYGDSYIDAYKIANSQTAEAFDKSNARAELNSVKESIRQEFMAARDLISENIEVPLIENLDNEEDSSTSPGSNSVFVLELKKKLNEAAQVNASVPDFAQIPENGGEPQAIADKFYLQAARIAGNQELKGLLISTDFDAFSDKELFDFINQVNEILVNDLSTIQSIKRERVKWSDVIDEIQLKTIEVDRNFSDNFFEQIGGIRYTSYDFDKSGPSISIVGEIKRYDTTNFTMISNLIDSLNGSEFFENGNMQTFSKSGSLDTGYTSALRLVLDLEKFQAATYEETQDEVNLEDGFVSQPDQTAAPLDFESSPESEEETADDEDNTSQEEGTSAEETDDEEANDSPEEVTPSDSEDIIEENPTTSTSDSEETNDDNTNSESSDSEQN